MKERRTPQPVVVRCKLVLVGDVQCGKTAMLQVLAKDCYPEVSPLPSRGRSPPVQDSGLPLPQAAPRYLAFWLEDCPVLLPLRPDPLLPPGPLLLTSLPGISPPTCLHP